MSEERKEQRPLDSRLPGEEDLSALYQQTEKDVPPPSLDATVLDAARQAVRSRSRRIYFFPSRKWIVPLSLAAALWVAIEIVWLRQPEIARSPQLRFSAPPSPLVVQPEEDTRPVAAPVLRSKREAVEEKTNVTSDMVDASLEATPQQTTSTVPRGQEMQAMELAAPPPPLAPQEPSMTTGATPALAPSSRASTAARSMAAETRQEQVLSPKEWLARIKELRRAGKHAEAEESFKAFKQRYPEYPVEKFLEKR
jgi:hypothetical protein